jgi:4-hydroxy-tetrahydrodipicolinate reductase
MNNYTDYDVSMEEIHHIHKLDKPSGTAITLAEQVITNIDRKDNWSITHPAKETLFIKN